MKRGDGKRGNPIDKGDRNDLQKRSALLRAPRDGMVKRYDFGKKFSSEIGEAWSGGYTDYQLERNTTRLYTDGSKIEGEGCGIALLRLFENCILRKFRN